MTFLGEILSSWYYADSERDINIIIIVLRPFVLVSTTCICRYHSYCVRVPLLKQCVNTVLSKELKSNRRGYYHAVAFPDIGHKLD